MEQAGDKADSDLEDTQIALGQGPVPPSPQSSVHKKRIKKQKWAEQSQLRDPRVDPMQRQLEEIRKTIDYMAARQQCLLDVSHQSPPFRHFGVVSLTASDNLDKTDSSCGGSSGQLFLRREKVGLMPNISWTG